MKTLKTISSAAVLVLALSASIYAGEISSPGAPCIGDIGTPGATSPAPSPTSTSVTPGDTGLPLTLADILLGLVSLL